MPWASAGTPKGSLMSDRAIGRSLAAEPPSRPLGGRQPGKGLAADPQVLVIRVDSPGKGKDGVSLAAQLGPGPQGSGSMGDEGGAKHEGIGGTEDGWTGDDFERNSQNRHQRKSGVWRSTRNAYRRSWSIWCGKALQRPREGYSSG